MKKYLTILLAALLLLLVPLTGCQSQPRDTTLDSLENCHHIEEYHRIPAELIRYVGNERFEQEFETVYKDKEGYNIVNFIRVFELSEDNFKAIVQNYGMRMNETTEYDVDLLYSGDTQRIEAYFTKS